MPQKTVKNRMCWREVEFPPTGYVVAPLIRYSSRGKNYPLPLMRLAVSMAEVFEYYHALAEEETHPLIELTGTILLQPLNLEKTYPHTPAHWGKPGPIQPDIVDRMSAYIDVFTKPEFYHILVTPDGKDKQGRETFTVDMPFLYTTSETDIDRYIKNSNLPVDETAAHSAFYTPQPVFQIHARDGVTHSGN